MAAKKPDIQKMITARVIRRLPKKRLEERIAAFLKTQRMCVLATSSADIPRATPLEYRSEGTTLYMMIEKGRKVENINRNPRVSVGIYAPYKGWLSVRGAQITGLAKILTISDGEEFLTAASIYPWRKYVRELGLRKLPANVHFLKVKASMIEFIDMSLKAEGFAAGQVWTRSEEGKS